MSVAVGSPSPKSTSAPSLPRSSSTFGHQSSSPHASAFSSSENGHSFQKKVNGIVTAPVVNVNGSPHLSSRTSRTPKFPINASEGDDAAWGSNFWVTLVDPQTQVAFFACPATGQVSWDPPVGSFVLPPNADGEWWELSDESRGGLPYYYQTKTSETVWERPEGFVIPLGIIQNTTLGRRLSSTYISPAQVTSKGMQSPSSATHFPNRPANRRSLSYSGEQDRLDVPSSSSAQGGAVNAEATMSRSQPPSPGSPRRTSSSDPHHSGVPGRGRSWANSQHLPPIPGSPYATDGSLPSSPPTRKSSSMSPLNGKVTSKHSSPVGPTPTGSPQENRVQRSRSKSSPYVPQRSLQQSLNAAVEMFATSPPEKASVSESGHSHGTLESSLRSDDSSVSEEGASTSIYGKGYRNNAQSTPTKARDLRKRDVPASPRRPVPATPNGGHFWSTRNSSIPSLTGKDISGPVLNHEATLNMSPVKNRSGARPILLPTQAESRPPQSQTATVALGTGKSYPVLPHDLASDIQQFVESDYAKQYFSTHRIGFIFRRKVPVAQMMTWQKAPLQSPLLTLNRSLNKDAVKIFKVIQRIMGDRERDRPVGVRILQDSPSPIASPMGNASTSTLVSNSSGVLEEERWLLGEGLTHGELRDEIYCQLMKQLNGNPSPESIFKGWQLLCVLLITFPPSKNFETSLSSFMQQRTTLHEGRVDVMAKFCIRRLAFISRKGPRGKPPTVAEIETASDAAFNPSTFGETLDATIRLQERNYPHQKVPIILPFLADGILALGGTKSEGIFRVPGDGDSVSELKLRIERGYYTLDGEDDPHVLASLLKLWLRELCDPLVPEEMYNECITESRDPGACVGIVRRLPTINRRVVLFVISFLQLFLEDRIQTVTKMTPANLALVMAPNLLRCNSESMAVVFTNAQYEQMFVFNLLLYLKCSDIDKDYTPAHGLGAVPPSPLRMSKTRSRRTRRPSR